MKTWIIQSGDEQWVSQADEPFDAAVCALKNRRPTGRLGQLMSAREPHVEDMTDDCYAMSTKRVLEAAGIRFVDHSSVGKTPSHE